MRWRCLTKPCMFKPVRASKIIGTCGAMHNFTVSHNLQLDEEFNQDIVDVHNMQEGNAIMQENDAGIQVRNELIQPVYTR